MLTEVTIQSQIMAKETTAAVTLGAQIGGVEAHDRTHRSIVELRTLLSEMCVGPYSDEVKEFAPILRVDGSIQQFGFRGLRNLRTSKKDGYITVEIGITKPDWETRSESEFRALLFQFLSSACSSFIQRLQKDKVYLDSTAFLTDLEEVQAHHLG